MALPGKKAKELQGGTDRLKLLLYGPWKVGKTIAACQFPQSYFIDTEHGASKEQYIELLQKADATYYETNEFSDLVSVVKALISEEHAHPTLVIDPISTLYSDLLDVGERVKGDDWGRHYNYADQYMKRLFLLIDRLDMNTIITSHAKPEYEGGGKDRQATGKLSPDAWKKLPYAFDLIIELTKRGDMRVAEVRGSRLRQFGDGEQFQWSYQEFTKRLGKEALERLGESIDMIDEAQHKELSRLMIEVGITEAQKAKILTKCKAASWEDLTSSQAVALIAHFNGKLAAASEAVAV